MDSNALKYSHLSTCHLNVCQNSMSFNTAKFIYLIKLEGFTTARSISWDRCESKALATKQRSMKTLKTRLRTIALFFMSMILFQSCVAYQKTTVSLQEAEQSKTRAKVHTSANQTYYFNQIVLEEEEFYGLKKVNGKIVRIAIHTNKANKVFLQSKRKSTWATIVVIAVPVISLAIIVATTDSYLTLNDVFE